MFYKNKKFKKAVGTLSLLITSISFSTNLAADLAANSIDDLIKEEMTNRHMSDLPKAWQAITIQHLLSHTSGLPNILTGNLVEMVGDGTDEGAWHAVQKHPMKSLLVKTGMHETAEHSFTIETSTNAVPQYVFSKSGHQPLPLNFPRILWPAAGMNASAKELAKFVIAVQSDKYFSSKQKANLWAPNMLNSGNTAGFNSRENGYAAGWQVIDRELHPAVSASGGNTVALIVYPQENLSIIVLTNLLGSLPIEFVDDIAAYYR